MSSKIMRGTTPTVTFFCDFSTATIGSLGFVSITFAQRGTILITKEGTDVTNDTALNSLSVNLSQTQTFLFDDDYDVQMQIRIKFQDATVIASDIITTTAGRLLESDVI